MPIPYDGSQDAKMQGTHITYRTQEHEPAVFRGGDPARTPFFPSFTMLGPQSTSAVLIIPRWVLRSFYEEVANRNILLSQNP